MYFPYIEISCVGKRNRTWRPLTTFPENRNISWGTCWPFCVPVLCCPPGDRETCRLFCFHHFASWTSSLINPPTGQEHLQQLLHRGGNERNVLEGNNQAPAEQGIRWSNWGVGGCFWWEWVVSDFQDSIKNGWEQEDLKSLFFLWSK